MIVVAMIWRGGKGGRERAREGVRTGPCHGCEVFRPPLATLTIHSHSDIAPGG